MRARGARAKTGARARCTSEAREHCACAGQLAQISSPNPLLLAHLARACVKCSRACARVISTGNVSYVLNNDNAYIYICLGKNEDHPLELGISPFSDSPISGESNGRFDP